MLTFVRTTLCTKGTRGGRAYALPLLPIFYARARSAIRHWELPVFLAHPAGYLGEATETPWPAH